MVRNKDLRKFIGKKVKDTVTGLEGLCAGCSNYLMGGDLLLVEYQGEDGVPHDVWNPYKRYELLSEDQE